ncbi:hypothetical protein HK405_001467, partial [Cladochytrium tenue]
MSLTTSPSAMAKLTSSLRSSLRFASDQNPPSLMLRRVSSAMSEYTPAADQRPPRAHLRSSSGLLSDAAAAADSDLHLHAEDDVDDSQAGHPAHSHHPRSKPRPVPMTRSSATALSPSQLPASLASTLGSHTSLASLASPGSSTASSPALFAWMSSTAGASASRPSLTAWATSGKAARRWSAAQRVPSVASSLASSLVSVAEDAPVPTGARRASRAQLAAGAGVAPRHDSDSDDAGLEMLTPRRTGGEVARDASHAGTAPPEAGHVPESDTADSAAVLSRALSEGSLPSLVGCGVDDEDLHRPQQRDQHPRHHRGTDRFVSGFLASSFRRR